MKIYDSIERNQLDYTKNPFANDVDLNNLYKDWLNDVSVELPNKTYQGNCTKEFCEILINKYAESEYERIQSIEFPNSGISYTMSRMLNEYKSLQESTKSIKTLSPIISNFHKWSLDNSNTEGNLSPYNGWQLIKNNKEEFLKFYRNRLRCSDYYKEKDNYKLLLQGIVPEFIYYVGLSTSRKYPRPSYFKPHLAKHIIETYLNEYSTIFDPFSGFSGRMLGTLACGKQYIGQDICKSIVKEQSEIYKFLKSNFDIPNAVLTNTDTITSTGSYECLFTCSPYQLKENWPGVNLHNYTCDEWIDICLNNFKCDKYVFVVDDKIEKYKDYIIETLENISHFKKNNEYILVIPSKHL